MSYQLLVYYVTALPVSRLSSDAARIWRRSRRRVRESGRPRCCAVTDCAFGHAIAKLYIIKIMVMMMIMMIMMMMMMMIIIIIIIIIITTLTYLISQHIAIVIVIIIIITIIIIRIFINNSSTLHPTPSRTPRHPRGQGIEQTILTAI